MKRKRNYYKLLFYLLLSLVIAYALWQGRKREARDESIDNEYVNFKLAKKYCPATILLAGHMLVVDKTGTMHNWQEWAAKTKAAKRRY